MKPATGRSKLLLQRKLSSHPANTRVIMMLVPAGKIVDAVIKRPQTFLSKKTCWSTQRQFAFYGYRCKGLPSLAMKTGSILWEPVFPAGNRPSFGQTSCPVVGKQVMQGSLPCSGNRRKVKKESCGVAHMGTGSARHYVKMVNNGIEYAIMQMISEPYHLLKQVAMTSPMPRSKMFLKDITNPPFNLIS